MLLKVAGIAGFPSPVFMQENSAPPKSIPPSFAPRKLTLKKVEFERLTSLNSLSDKLTDLKLERVRF
jgi:hypothetical protein